MRTSALLAALLLGALFTTVPAAHAQGPAPFPELLSSGDLNGWCKRLELDTAQKAAAGSAFERYLASAQALRDGDIADYADKAANSPGGPRRELAELEQISKRAKSIESRIAADENRLFDELSGIVPESKRTLLNSLRAQAARRRAVATVEMFQRGGLAPDVIDILNQDEHIDAANRARAMTALASYEGRITDLMEKIAAFSLESGPTIRKAADAATGGQAGDPSDREVMQRRMQARQEALAPLNKLRGEVCSQHRKAVHGLEGILSPEEFSSVHARFVRSVYTQIGTKNDTPERILEAAAKHAKSGEIPEATFQSAQAIVKGWRESESAVEEEMMDVLDARRAAGRGGPMAFDGGGGLVVGGNGDDKMDELQEKRVKLANDAIDSVKALHPLLADAEKKSEPGPQIAFGPGGLGGEGRATFTAVMVVSDGGQADAITFDSSPLEISGSFGGGVRAMEARDFNDMLARAQLPEELRTVAQASFDRYHERVEADRAETIGTAAAIGPGVFEAGGARVVIGDEEENEGDAAARKAKQRDFTERLMASDKALFADLNGIVDPAGQARVSREEALRQRDVYRQRCNSGGPGMLRPSGNFESVELVSILASSKLNPARLSAAEAVVSAHAERLTPLLEQLASASERMRDLESGFTRVFRSGDKRRIEKSVQVQANDNSWADARRALTEAQNQVSAEIQHALADLRATLAPEEFRRVKRGVYASALPGLAKDPHSAESRLEQASSLPTLTDEQRMKVVSLLVDNQKQVDDLMDRFVEEADRKAQALESSSDFDMKAMRLSQSMQKRLRFDRDEVHEAAMRRLRAALSTEQNAQVEDLPGTSGSRAITLPFVN